MSIFYFLSFSKFDIKVIPFWFYSTDKKYPETEFFIAVFNTLKSVFYRKYILIDFSYTTDNFDHNKMERDWHPRINFFSWFLCKEK